MFSFTLNRYSFHQKQITRHVVGYCRRLRTELYNTCFVDKTLEVSSDALHRKRRDTQWYCCMCCMRDKCVGLFDNLGLGHSGKKYAVRFGRTYLSMEQGILSVEDTLGPWGIEDG